MNLANPAEILILAAVGACAAAILIRKIRRCRRGQYCDCGCGGCRKCKK
jgi:hypothetical protein